MLLRLTDGRARRRVDEQRRRTARQRDELASTAVSTGASTTPRTLEGLGARLRYEIDLDALGSELHGVVRETRSFRTLS